MDNHQISAREVVRQGLQRTWNAKWTALGIVTSLFVAFIIVVGFFYAILWFIDMATAYRISGGLISMTGLAGIDQIKAFAPFFHMIFYGIFSLLLSGLIIPALSRYWFVKMFVLQARNGHVVSREIMADLSGFWSVFWGQAFLNIAAYLLVFVVVLFVILPLLGIALFFNAAQLLVLVPIVIMALIVMMLLFLLRMRYFSCFAIDKNTSALQSLGLSYHSTKGYGFKILQYLLLYVLLMVVMAMAREIVSLIPTSTALGVVAIGLLMFAYLILFLMISASIYASDVYVYNILKQTPEAPQ